MAKRTLFQAGVQSTLRISTSGEADSGDFQNLLFDGNQNPLRVWNVGYIAVNPIPKLGSGGLAYPIVAMDGSTNYPGSAHPPIFLVMGRNGAVAAGNMAAASHKSPTAPFQRGGSQGFGGLITEGGRYFYGINFNDPNNNTDNGYPVVVYPTYINYCVFKNAG